MNAPIVNSKRLLELLQKLIKIDSVNPSLVQGSHGEQEISQFIGRYLNTLGLEVEYQELGENRGNVIGIMRGSGNGRSLMLNGHTDTVSIEGMEIEPLEPIYKNGRIYGRGAFDMKGSLAAMLLSAEAIIKSSVKLKGDVIFTFVADEEYASIGTEEVVKRYSADSAIVCEPTGLDIITTHRGFAWAKIIVHGKRAHGSMYDVGVDAIAKAGKVLVALENLDGRLKKAHPHPLLGRGSVHASLIEGGIELSTYPDSCRIEYERRTLPHETLDVVSEEIDTILQELGSEDSQFQADSEILLYRSGLETSPDEEIVQTIQLVSERILTQPQTIIGAPWWTDAALISDSGTPSVLFGPSGDGAHSAVEYVDFESVVSFANILNGVIIEMCENEL
ncbi:MAG: ArgE/DapE family deacylase [Candidatus Thorarchaeota archaeon]